MWENRGDNSESQGIRVLRKVEPVASHESLALEWVFGLHKDFRSVVHNLSTSITERVAFYTVGHVGVIYDAINNTQRHLMGHRNAITVTATSRSRRFLVTADSSGAPLGAAAAYRPRDWNGSGDTNKELADQGTNTTTTAAAAAVDGNRWQRSAPSGLMDEENDDSVMIVWDAQTGTPVRTIPTGQYGGVVACAMSLDAMYIATLNKRTPQEIMVWGWTADKDCDERGVLPEGVEFAMDKEIEPEYSCLIPAQDEQTSIRFSSDDPHLIVTNGLRRVLFWSWSEGKLKYYSPPIIAKNFKVPVGQFTQSIFVPGTSMACSGTVDGDVILWEVQPHDRVTKEQDKTMLKMVRIHTSGVSFLSASSGYIVTGGIDGHVKFLDQKLRLVAWFDNLGGGAITSVSFDRPAAGAMAPMEELLRDFKSATQKKAANLGLNAVRDFGAPNFMVSTAKAMIIDVSSKAFHSSDAELMRGKLIVQGQEHGIQCIAAHPHLTHLAIAGHSGSVHVWDYDMKRVCLMTVFRSMQIHCMVYDPKGTYLAVGFANGILKLLEAETLEEHKSFKPKRPDGITRLIFTEDGERLAVGDSAGCVSLYEFAHPPNNRTQPKEWDLVGRHKTHRAAISGLQFGGELAMPRLISVGEDQRLVEYDLLESEAEAGLLVRSAHKITQGAVPTGMLWIPVENIVADMNRRLVSQTGEAAVNDVLLIGTSEYKLHVFLSDWSRQCVKTLLAPTFGGAISEMFSVPTQPGSDTNCLFYSTREKVIGLMQLPLEGDPCASTGLLAHPGAIASVARSCDGAFVFTAGGEDHSVMQWRVNGEKIMPPEEAVLPSGSQMGEVPLDHLISAVEGGCDGHFMREIVDYFYYAQIRLQGEETTAKRELLGAVPFSQLPNLFRALGYYPSELEIGRLTYEVASMYGSVDEPIDECDVASIPLKFSQFMRLYVNYRPTFGITRYDIEKAFAALGANPVNGQISRDVFFKLLSTHGEPLEVAEIAAALRSLLGDGVRVDMLEDTITARAFAENLLGFEDYDVGLNMEATLENGDIGQGEEMPLDL